MKKCFVISPIGAPKSDVRKSADMVFHSIVKPALAPLGFEVWRSDHDPEPGMITDQVIRAIVEDDLAVADLTGLNPNVFYELGLRHLAVKPVIHVAVDGTPIPFDNGGHKAIFFDLGDYHSHERARTQIAKAAEAIAKPGYAVSNPVTQARAVIKLSESADSKDTILVEMMRRLEGLESTLHAVRRDQRRGTSYAPGEYYSHTHSLIESGASLAGERGKIVVRNALTGGKRGLTVRRPARQGSNG